MSATKTSALQLYQGGGLMVSTMSAFMAEHFRSCCIHFPASSLRANEILFRCQEHAAFMHIEPCLYSTPSDASWNLWL